MVHTVKRMLFSAGGAYKNLWYFIVLSRIGNWFRRSAPYEKFKERKQLYDFVSRSVNGPVLYLEFGVYKGQSIRYWSEINKQEGSRFWGFDTFSGLPENWTRLGGDLQKGTFDVGGKFPEISDRRVGFIKGLFQDSLPEFIASPNFNDSTKLILHLDADLYSSTLYVLCTMHQFLKPGTIIIFDEFTSGDEYLALENYASSFRKEYKVLGVAGPSYQQVAIEITK